MRIDSHSISALALINFDLVGMESCAHHHLFALAWFNRDGAIMVDDGDAGPVSDFERKLLASCLISGKRCQDKYHHDGKCCRALLAMHNLSPHFRRIGLHRPLCPTAYYGRERSKAIS